MDPLFRLTGTSRDDRAVEDWFFDPSRPLRLSVRPWYLALKGQGPMVLERLHDGRPTLCLGDLAWAYVDAFSGHAAVGFFRGAMLPDPAGLLRGQGRAMRHVKLASGLPSDTSALHALIAAAWADIRAIAG